MTPDATYVSLNFDNPELKKFMPLAGTHKGAQALPGAFAAVAILEKLDICDLIPSKRANCIVADHGLFIWGKDAAQPNAVMRSYILFTTSSISHWASRGAMVWEIFCR